MKIGITPQLRRELDHLPLRVRAALAGAGGRGRAVLAALDRNLERMVGIGTGGLLLALLLIGAVDHLTDADTEPTHAAPAAAEPSAPSPAPVSRAPVSPVPLPPAQNPAGSAPTGATTHQVVAGETLAGIALRHGVGYRQIAAANRIADPHRITPGQRLAIPAATPGTVLIAPGDTLGGHAQRAGLTITRVQALNPAVHNPHHITAGDHLRVHP